MTGKTRTQRKLSSCTVISDNLYMTKDKHGVKVKEKNVKEKESKHVRKMRVQRDMCLKEHAG